MKTEIEKVCGPCSLAGHPEPCDNCPKHQPGAVFEFGTWRVPTPKLQPGEPGYTWVDLQKWINSQYQKGRVLEFGQYIFDAAQAIHQRHVDLLHKALEENDELNPKR